MIPTLPSSLAENHVSLDKMSITTKFNENFLLLNDPDSNLVIFGTVNNLKYLANSETIYLDGSFDYAAAFFKQIFTLYVYFNWHYIPLAFCLLTNKCETTCTDCFKKLCLLCQENGFNLNPSAFVVDFEVAIHNLIKSVWPSSSITGCRFHLTQSWFRKIQELGLVVEYKNNNSLIGEWLRVCFGFNLLRQRRSETLFCF